MFQISSRFIAMFIALAVTAGTSASVFAEPNSESETNESVMLYQEQLGGPYFDEWYGLADAETFSPAVYLNLSRMGKSGSFLVNLVLDCKNNKHFFGAGIEYYSEIVSADMVRDIVPLPVVESAKKSFCK